MSGSVRGEDERPFGVILWPPTIGASGLTHAGVQPNGVRLILPFVPGGAANGTGDVPAVLSGDLAERHHSLLWRSLVSFGLPKASRIECPGARSPRLALLGPRSRSVLSLRKPRSAA